MRNIFVPIFILLLALSACQTIQVECGSAEANGLNANLNQLRDQTLLVQRGYKEESETTSTPYVTQYWNGFQYVSQTKYHYNTVKKQIPVNIDYEKKVLRGYVDNMINYLQYAKDTKASCEQKGLQTFTLNEPVVTQAINQAEFVLN